ncbi:MAG: hypothetical protein ACO28M_03480 [Vulcanococcus sp.]
MAVKSKTNLGKEFKSRAKFKKTHQGDSVRSKARPGRKKYRGQGR